MEFPLLCDIEPRERDIERTVIMCIAFHPTANPPILAVSFQHRPVQLWRFSDTSFGGGCGVLVGNLDATPVYLYSIAFHPTATPPILAIAKYDCIELWRVITLPTGFLSGIMVCRFDTRDAETLVFHPINGFLASGSGHNKPLNLWDLASPLIIMRPGEGLCRVTIPGLTAGIPVVTGLETSHWTPLMPPNKRAKYEEDPNDLKFEKNPIELLIPIPGGVKVTYIAFHPTIPLRQGALLIVRRLNYGAFPETNAPDALKTLRSYQIWCVYIGLVLLHFTQLHPFWQPAAAMIGSNCGPFRPTVLIEYKLCMAELDLNILCSTQRNPFWHLYRVMLPLICGMFHSMA